MKKDIIVIGGCIAGVSAAYFLSEFATVTVFEREEYLGYHSSSRSAAQFTVGISARTMRHLAAASLDFLKNPPAGFAAHPLVNRRGCLTVGRRDQEPNLARMAGYITDAAARAELIDGDQALALFPALRAEKVEAGVYEPDAMDIDADMLLQGYARGARARGAEIVTSTGITAITRDGGLWQVEAGSARVAAPLVLNAAGAWVDHVAALAGLGPIGLTPYRRTAFTFAGPAGIDCSRWPHVSNVDYRWYVQPDAGRLMGSLADAVPVPPADVHPDDIDVAQGIDNIEQDTTFRIARPLSRWAGLRSYVADRNPVCGTRADAPGFFWLAGQGGCGILTSPALGRAAAALMRGHALPPDLTDRDITIAGLAPDRATLKK